MKYLKYLFAINFSILSLLPIAVLASGSVTTNTASSNNQLLGTILMGAGILIILIAIVVILNKLKGNGEEKSPIVETPVGMQPQGEVLPEALNEVPKPEVVPPVDNLEKVNSPVTVQTPISNTTLEVKPSSNDAANLENLPKVPLSELTGDSIKEEKSYSLEDIQKGEDPTSKPQ